MPLWRGFRGAGRDRGVWNGVRRRPLLPTAASLGRSRPAPLSFPRCTVFVAESRSSHNELRCFGSHPDMPNHVEPEGTKSDVAGGQRGVTPFSWFSFFLLSPQPVPIHQGPWEEGLWVCPGVSGHCDGQGFFSQHSA